MSRTQRKLSLVLLFTGALLSNDPQALPALPPSPTTAAIRQWVKDLNHDRFTVREAATRQLLQAGKRALPVLAEEVDWKNLEVRRRALGILEKFSYADDTETAGAAAAVLSQLVASPGPAAEAARLALGDRWLSPANEGLLKSLLRDFLFDPQGAEYVQAVISTTRSSEEKRTGWLVKTKAGNRIYFTDGDSIPVLPSVRVIRIDFLARCRKVYGLEHARAPNGEPIERASIHDLECDHTEPSVLVDAAWLYRLGHPTLAAKILARVPDKGAESARLRQALARDRYRNAVTSFQNQQDETAAAQLERLLRLYPVEAKEFPQAKRLRNELARMKKEGLLGRAGADNLPGHFARLEPPQQLAFLIDTLDLVQDDRSAFVLDDYPSFQKDCRVAALLNLSEFTIPALIDTLANDDRFTRMVCYPDRRNAIPHVISVREVALPVAQSILRVDYLDPHEIGWGYCRHDEDDLKKSATALRNYWTAFGRLPFEDRMMHVLRDPKASSGAMREAAENLAMPEKNDRRGFWHHLSHDPGKSPGEPRAAVMKFTAPTAAEAILAAMDRDLSGSHREEAEPFLTRADIEDGYLFPLIALGDRCIVRELTKRAEHTGDVHMRRKWALACFHLGNPRPLRRFAQEVRVGAIRDLSVSELKGIVSYFVSVSLPETDRALYALADPAHPLFDAAVTGILEEDSFHGNPFLAHPSCLRLLGGLLKDPSLTKTTIAISGDSVTWSYPNGLRSRSLPEILKNPSKRKEEAQERRCDKAAAILADVVLGFPEYYALLNDADDRIRVMTGLLDRYAASLRPLTRAESDSPPWEVRYAPLLPPLGRAATAADVRAGRAIFHLDGKGKSAAIELPARGIWKKTAEGEKPREDLIVQAEVGPDGHVVYGVIERHAIRAMAANVFVKVEPLLKVERKSPPR